MLLRANTNSITRAVGWALLALASETAITTSAVALSPNAQPTVTAITWAGGLNLTDITLPALLAEALALKTISVARAIGNHLATFESTIWARPSLLTFASRALAGTVCRASGSTRAKWTRAINARTSGAETLSVDAKTLSRAIVGTSHTCAVDSSERLWANLRPLLGAVIRSILGITAALSVNTETMSVATILAVQKLACTSVETLVAVTFAVSAHTVVRATERAVLKRAIKAGESNIALALEVR